MCALSSRDQRRSWRRWSRARPPRRAAFRSRRCAGRTTSTSAREHRGGAGEVRLPEHHERERAVAAARSRSGPSGSSSAWRSYRRAIAASEVVRRRRSRSAGTGRARRPLRRRSLRARTLPTEATAASVSPDDRDPVAPERERLAERGERLSLVRRVLRSEDRLRRWTSCSRRPYVTAGRVVDDLVRHRPERALERCDVA